MPKAFANKGHFRSAAFPSAWKGAWKGGLAFTGDILFAKIGSQMVNHQAPLFGKTQRV
jgi:hypothetical protein